MAKVLSQLPNLGCNYDRAIACIRMAFEIISMILFSLVKVLEWFNSRHDFVLPEIRIVRFSSGLFGNLSLLLVVIKDNRSVLGTYVIPLPVLVVGLWVCQKTVSNSS